MKTLIGIIIAIIVIAGGWYWYANYYNPSAMNPAGDSAAVGTTSTTTTGSGTDVNINVNTGTAPMTATVTYTSSGFSPATVTIAKGGSITFVNQSGNPMWVASDPHPTHTAYDGTTREAHCAAGYTGAAPFDQCTNSNSYTFTFDKTGSWGYHNHLGADDTGTVIVQ